jgi:hypothetical protein
VEVAAAETMQAVVEQVAPLLMENTQSVPQQM